MPERCSHHNDCGPQCPQRASLPTAASSHLLQHPKPLVPNTQLQLNTRLLANKMARRGGRTHTGCSVLRHHPRQPGRQYAGVCITYVHSSGNVGGTLPHTFAHTSPAIRARPAAPTLTQHCHGIAYRLIHGGSNHQTSCRRCLPLPLKRATLNPKDCGVNPALGACISLPMPLPCLQCPPAKQHAPRHMPCSRPTKFHPSPMPPTRRHSVRSAPVRAAPGWHMLAVALRKQPHTAGCCRPAGSPVGPSSTWPDLPAPAAGKRGSPSSEPALLPWHSVSAVPNSPRPTQHPLLGPSRHQAAGSRQQPQPVSNAPSSLCGSLLCIARTYHHAPRAGQTAPRHDACMAAGMAAQRQHMLPPQQHSNTPSSNTQRGSAAYQS
jgi:hypothetical protein